MEFAHIFRAFVPFAIGLAAAFLGSTYGAPASSRPAPARIDFNAHIRPILNQNCTACHGGVKTAGDISFVYRESATQLAKKSGRPVIKPGEPDASEMIKRVTSTDSEYRMPPSDHAPALPAEKVALLRQWIKEGAVWQEHWAFVAPKSQRPPVVKKGAWARGTIDRFVLARLEREKLMPAREAARPALLRRASFDLIGLPPTPDEIAAFVADRSPDAYERQIDRLLDSPHFGERWASPWLDLARYADTKGYESDGPRQMWKYREWVVDALNRNLPYDRFVTEQLAGDLLPERTIEQQIATAFHRQTQVNDEGGTDDEEYRLSAVMDRVATTWAVTNAVTFNCVQCHAHPYEPIRHEEYYRYLSFFNTTRDADFPREHPTLRVPDDPSANADAARLQQEIEQLRREVVTAGKAVEAHAAQWQPLAVGSASSKPEVTFALRDGEVEATGTIAATARYELTLPLVPTSDKPITALRFAGLPLEPEKAKHTPERGFIVARIDCAVVAPDGSVSPVQVGRFFPDSENLPNRTIKLPPNTPVKEDAEVSPAPNEGSDVTLDFHFAAHPTLSTERWVVAALAEPLRAGPGATLRVTISHGLRISNKPAAIRRLRVTFSADERWTALAGDPELARRAARVTEAYGELVRMQGSDLPVMEELPRGERRETRLFVRGNFLEKSGSALAPGVPALFPPLPKGAPPDRLTLARWYFQPDQPLTARVAVNRMWEQLFGTGIVETLEDFGSVGERPSHPELLDWLALRFQQDLRWNVKAMLREIVTSAAYRQDATVTPVLLEKDPRNRLLARGPRQRLSAEMVRDGALAAAGLLSPKLHGPPVMPPQPAGVWATVYNARNWVNATGEDRYRRALYTFWKRTSAYPSFLTFDAPARDLCLARRTPTNTPLQALVTLNDEVYQEAAAALGQRAREAGADVDAQIARAFELAVSRPPAPAEAAPLRRLYDAALAQPADESADREGRALTAVASAILNLDAALIR